MSTATIDTITEITEFKRISNFGSFEYYAIKSDGTEIQLSENQWKSITLNRYKIAMSEVVYTYKVNKPGKPQDKSKFTLRRGFPRKAKGNPIPGKFSYRMMWKSGGLESTILGGYERKQWMTSDEYNTILSNSALKSKTISIEERFSVIDHSKTPKIKKSWSTSPVYTGGNDSKPLSQSGKSKNPNGPWTNPEDIWVVTCLGYVDEGQSLELVVSPPISEPAGEKVSWTAKHITTDKKDFPDKRPYGNYLTSGAREDTLSIPIKMDSNLEEPEKFILTLKYGGAKVFVKEITINDVQPTVNQDAWKLVPSTTSVDEGEEFTVTLVRPAGDTTAPGTAIPFKWKGTGVNFRDFTSGSHIGNFITGSEETLSFTFKADEGTEGTEIAQLVLTGGNWATCRVTVNDTSVTPVTSYIKYVHEFTGTGMDQIEPTFTASTGTIESPTEATWRTMNNNPITAQATLGATSTAIYGTTADITVANTEILLGPNARMKIQSSDPGITTFRLSYAGTDEAQGLVPGHDVTNGGWYIDGDTVYCLFKTAGSRDTLQQMIDKASDVKTFTPGFGKMIGDTKLVVTFPSNAIRTASFDIVSPSGEVLNTIQAINISTEPEIDSFEMSVTLNPGDEMFNQDDVYIVRAKIESEATASVGLKMDPEKNYMFDVVSVDPGPWSDTLYAASMPSGDDYEPAQQYFTGRTTIGDFLGNAGLMTRMTFDIDDQSGGRAEWMYSETYYESGSSTNLTTASTHTAFHKVLFNRLRDQVSTVPTWIEGREDALPTHDTDYNMHKIYLKIRNSGSLTKTITCELYEIDDAGDKVGDKIADLTFETGTTIGTDGWIAASDVSWNVNTVSN